MTLKTRLRIYLALLHALGFAALVYYHEHLGWWFLVLEVALAISLIAGLKMVNTALEPLDFVRSFSDVVESGEYNARYSRIGQADMDRLINTFNLMLSRLQAEQLRLGEQRGFLERFLRVTPIGVIILDFQGSVRVANPASQAFLSHGADELLDRRLAEIDDSLARRLDALEVDSSVLVTDAQGRRLRCSRSEFFDRGFARSYFTIEELTEELRRSERSAYEKLIRMMSHEVNNTVAATNSILQSAQGYGESLASEDRIDFSESLDVVMTRNTHLNEFTRQFANLVRLPEPELRPEETGELVDAVRAIFQPELERRQVRLDLDVDQNLPSISLDRNQMEQVLMNVVKNALESIERDGTITIATWQERGEVVLTVTDDGAGLTPESRENLFTPFYTSKEQGQGLGLTLVKEILTQHRFGFSLRTEGRLTEFRIRMPVG